MIPASVIAKLATLGLSSDQACAVAAMLSDVERATSDDIGKQLEVRRASDRARKQKQRHGTSRDVTGQDVTSGTEISCARDIDTKLSNILPKDIPTVYQKGKADDVAAGEAAAEILGALECPDTASAMQALVADTLEQNGFDVELESPTADLGDYRQGRIDVVASRGGGRVGIELDTRRPRRRSLVKLRLFEGYRIVGLRGINGIHAPEGIDRVVGLPVRQATHEEAADKRIYDRSSKPTSAGAQARVWFAKFLDVYPPRDGNNPKKPAFDVFSRLLKSGADPEAIIAGTRAYAASREGEAAKFTVQAVRFLRDRMFEDVHQPSTAARAKAATPPVADARVFVELDAPEWGKWIEYRRLIKAPRPVPYEQQGTRKRGAYFPSKVPPISSQWPPDATVTHAQPMENGAESNAQTRNAPERQGPRLQASGSR